MRVKLYFLILISGIIFGACSEPKAHHPPLADFPVGGGYDIPDAIFLSPSHQVKTYWYAELDSVLSGDVVLKIVRCENPDYLICMVYPYPVFLPKKTTNKHKVFQSGQSYKVSFSVENGGKLQPLTCDNSYFWMKVANKSTRLNYWYFFQKDVGLAEIITFSKGQNLPEIPSEVLNLSEGKLFPFR